MSNVVDLEEKFYEKNSTITAMSELAEDISDFLPKSSISQVVIQYCCKVYLYNKELKYNWMDKIDCYLGLPSYVKNQKDLNNVSYKVFPLSLVFHIAQTSRNDFTFALCNETSFTNEESILHFDYFTFENHMSEFEAGLENNLENWAGKVTLKWKALIKRIRDKTYKYAEQRISTQLNHYWHTIYRYNLKQSIFNVMIKDNYDLYVGKDYGIHEHLKKRGDFDEFSESIEFLDIPTLYELVLNQDISENYSMKDLFPTLDSFGADFIHFHLVTKKQFESDPTNFVIERELELMNQFISNSKKRLLKKIGYTQKNE
jgi:hypothetical protein